MGRAPLAGIRVADFSWVWAGPHCTLQLAHLGAEVIRVETKSRLCVTRLLPPFAEFKPHYDRSGYFNQYNQGKRSVTLDMKRPEALDVARRLCANSDVVVENFAAGVMERMGLGYDVLKTLRPDVVMISLSGYGAHGPDSDKVSYGPAQVPLSGMSSVTGYRDYPPMHVGVSYGDPTGGLHGAVALLAALIHRKRTGEGQYIDLSQWETSVAVLPEAVMAQSLTGAAPERDGNRDPHMAPHGVFPSAGEQRWVAVTVEDDAEWTRLARVIGGDALASDARFRTLADRKRHEDELEAVVAAWTAERDPEAVTDLLQAEGIPAFTVTNSKDLSTSPHLAARGFFVEHEHPVVGRRQHLGVPFRMSRSDASVRKPAPCLGADTDAVLRDVCGYGDDEIAALRTANVLA